MHRKYENGKIYIRILYEIQKNGGSPPWPPEHKQQCLTQDQRQILKDINRKQDVINSIQVVSRSEVPNADPQVIFPKIPEHVHYKRGAWIHQ